MRECVLIDVSNLMYKYLYIYSTLSVKAFRRDEDGNKVSYNKPMGHIYGLTEFIAGTVYKNPNLEFILAFDGTSPRRTLSDSYKDRVKFNPNYSVGQDTSGRYNVHQDVCLIIKLLSSLHNVFVLYDENLEADDLIYNYIRQYKDLYSNMYIVSEDRDLLINVDEKVTQYKKYPKGEVITNLGDDIKWDLETVRMNYFGLSGEDLIMYKSFVGDSSDTIKGYSRIPKKIAGYFSRSMLVKPDEDRVIKNKNIDESVLSEYIDTYGIKENALIKWLEVVKSDKSILINNYKLIKPYVKDIELYRSEIELQDSKELAKKYSLKRYLAFLNDYEYETSKKN